MSLAELIVLGPDEGKTVSVLGDRVTCKAVGRWRPLRHRRSDGSGGSSWPTPSRPRE